MSNSWQVEWESQQLCDIPSGNPYSNPIDFSKETMPFASQNSIFPGGNMEVTINTDDTIKTAAYFNQSKKAYIKTLRKIYIQ